jgi:hypothetical protein
MRLPAHVSWREVGTAFLVLVTVVLFVVCAVLATTNF